MLAGLALAGCGGGAAGADREDGRVVLRLGYFPNVTHATAIAGLQTGTFAQALGTGVRLEPKVFNAGPEVIEAVFGGALDASYIGPNPAINAFAKSDGKAIRIIAGATSGGAFLVVHPGIASAAALKGKTLASPQLGNTQDVALRSWLAGQGLETTTAGGGDVSIIPQANAEALAAFKDGQLDGAWVPEPWATRLVQEGRGRVLVDEADLWPDGQYVTTHLIVRTAFLDEHPDVVQRLLAGHVAATALVNDSPDQAKAAVNEGIEEATTKRLPEAVIDAAWENLVFTVDPVASSLERSAEAAIALQLLDPVDLEGIYDLRPLNAVLTKLGEQKVTAL